MVGDVGAGVVACCDVREATTMLTMLLMLLLLRSRGAGERNRAEAAPEQREPTRSNSLDRSIDRACCLVASLCIGWLACLLACSLSCGCWLLLCGCGLLLSLLEERSGGVLWGP